MVLALLVLLGLAANASAFTVTDEDDTGDSTLNGICDADGGDACTLRAAIQEANNTDAADPIDFNLVSIDLTVQTALPPITEQVSIDACNPNQAASLVPCKNLNTFQSGTDGLRLAQGDVDATDADNSTIRGFAIYGFTRGISTSSDINGATIRNNWFGLTQAGSLAENPNGIGVLLEGNNSTVGGVVGGQGNVFANYRSNPTPLSGIGLRIDGGDANSVQGNFFGTTSGGVGSFPQASNIEIRSIGPNLASGNTVGGQLDAAAAATTACDHACNVINSATGAGIDLDAGADGEEAAATIIRANYIGLDSAGVSGTGNNVGIDMGSADDTTIGGGGINPQDRSNWIANSANDAITADTGSEGADIDANRIGLERDNNTSAPNEGDQVQLGTNSTVFNNFIAGGTDTVIGVHILGDNNGVFSNAIGHNMAGAARPFLGPAVLVEGDVNEIGQVIGITEQGNSITSAGGTSPGVLILNASGNTLEANAIGTNSKASTADLGNAGAGVRIESQGTGASSGNLIGGYSALAQNKIAYNGGDAIEIVGAASDGNAVGRNFGDGNGVAAGDLFLDLGDDDFGNTTGINNGIQAPVGFVSTTQAAGLARPDAFVQSFDFNMAGGQSSQGLFAGSDTADSRGLYQVVYTTPPLTGLATNQSIEGEGTSESDVLAALQPSDPTPPQVTVSGPASTTDTTPTFNFGEVSPDLGSDLEIFVCAFDAQPYQFCTDQPTYTPSTPLGIGAHTITVNAIDDGANIDATEAVFGFTITAPPGATPPATSPPVRLRCKKGFKLKKVRGKRRCVRKKKKKK